MENPIIKIENVTFSYPEAEKPALRDVSLEIARGSFTAILGHNGSGKSTLAKCFNGILTPTEGRVLVNGLDTADEEKLLDIRRTVGMVFQNPDNQIVASVVEDDVAFAPENLGVPPAEIRQRVEAARALSRERFQSVGDPDYAVKSNAQMQSGDLARFCELDDAGTAVMEGVFRRTNLSARAYDRILRVARTLADLAGSEPVRGEDVFNAISYRRMDNEESSFWI